MPGEGAEEANSPAGPDGRPEDVTSRFGSKTRSITWFCGRVLGASAGVRWGLDRFSRFGVGHF